MALAKSMTTWLRWEGASLSQKVQNPAAAQNYHQICFLKIKIVQVHVLVISCCRC